MIPTSNKAQYLRRSFGSVLRQTFSAFEALVIDDASDDHSLSIINEYVRRDPRFRLEINDKPLKGHTTRAFGVFRSKGQWLLALDCDDELCNQTAEIDLAAAIHYSANMIEHRGLTVSPDGQRSPWCWPCPLLEADNVTLVCAFLIGKLNWQIWLRFIERTVYLKAIELIGDRLLFQNSRATDMLHCGAMLPFVKKYATVDYVGYIYYIALPESSYYRSHNRTNEATNIERLVNQLLISVVGDRWDFVRKYKDQTIYRIMKARPTRTPSFSYPRTVTSSPSPTEVQPSPTYRWGARIWNFF